MFQWPLEHFSASETGSHICDPRLGRANTVLPVFGTIYIDLSCK